MLTLGTTVQTFTHDFPFHKFDEAMQFALEGYRNRKALLRMDSNKLNK